MWNIDAVKGKGMSLIRIGQLTAFMVFSSIFIYKKMKRPE